MVENVSVRDGKLMTKSGEELRPAAEFQPAAEQTAAPPADNERLMRRGQ
jgi:hypothetical protein